MRNISQIGNSRFHTNIAIFKIEICGTLFNHYFKKRMPCSPYDLYENEFFQRCLSYDRKHKFQSDQNCFGPQRSSFSNRFVNFGIRFSLGPGTVSGFGFQKMPLILYKNLTKIFNFSNFIPECESRNLTLVKLFPLFDSGTYFWVAQHQLEVYDHAVVSVAIEFSSNSKKNATFYHANFLCQYIWYP